MIDIQPYKPTWSYDFKRLKVQLIKVMPKGAIIHHIGSTAVAGLAAKDIIDIQVSVDKLNQVDMEAVELAGFLNVPDIVDHCPAGLDLPADELNKLFYRGAGRATHVHIREIGRFNQRYALLCRDYLGSHGVAADSYVIIKQRLAEKFSDDGAAYYDIKNPVFDIIMAGANEWALRVNWTVPLGD